MALLFSWEPAISSEKPLLGRTLENLGLKDYRGKEYQLADFKDQKALVLVFIGVDCPLAKLYGPKLAKLASEYASRGVTFLAIDANSQDGLTQIASWARQHGITFPVLKDVGNQLADKLAATRTPEVFLLDAGRVVRYHGRIDDQYGIGVFRDAPKTHDLKQALNQILEGKAISNSDTPVTGCLIGRTLVPQANAKITFCKDVAPILNTHCVQCHRPEDIGPFSLLNYKDASGWAAMIGEVVGEGRMPPWHADPRHGSFANERRLSDAEKKTLLDWIAAGAPEGNPKDLPRSPEFKSGWILSREPDLVIPMRDKPYKVPASGTIRYQYFMTEPIVKEDKWASAIEVVPGNRAVVHHILVFVLPPNAKPDQEIDGVHSYLGAYVPGLRPLPFPDGMAKKIPAGSKLLFQVHYTPNGSEQLDTCRIAFLFTDPARLTHEVKTTSAVAKQIRIPPGDGNYGVDATISAAWPNGQVLGFMPHMHVRGKDFRYEAIYPDGKKETLLDVPHYDFNWQTNYRLASSRVFPPDTKIKCTAHFDNSEANPNNPNPKATVKWGDQTWDEMMIGYLELALPLVNGQSADIRELEAQVTIPPDGLVITEKLKKFLAKFDRDGDGKLSQKEVDAIPLRLRRALRDYLLDNRD